MCGLWPAGCYTFALARSLALCYSSINNRHLLLFCLPFHCPLVAASRQKQEPKRKRTVMCPCLSKCLLYVEGRLDDAPHAAPPTRSRAWKCSNGRIVFAARLVDVDVAHFTCPPLALSVQVSTFCCCSRVLSHFAAIWLAGLYQLIISVAPRRAQPAS